MAKILAFDRNRRLAEGRVRMPQARNQALAPFGFISSSEEQPLAEPDIIVSVVVPTRGRPQLLNRCLASLVLQHYDPQRFEIIVVDDEPDNETREIVTGWTAHTEANGPKVIYIPSMGPHGPAAARNHGWRAAVSLLSPTTTPSPAPTGSGMACALSMKTSSMRYAAASSCP